MKIRIGFRKYWLGSVATLGLVVMPANAVDPKVSNIQASQRAGTRLVDITYDVIDPDSPTLQIALEASDNSGASYLVPIVTVSGAVGHGVNPGHGQKITWDAANDWPNNYSSKMRFRVMASDVWLPSRGMVHVPEGIFTMGDERVVGASVLRSIRLSGFAMDRTEVTHAQWTEVRRWALARGYDLTMGLGSGTNHPVVGISWFDALKWCNARSEKEGLGEMVIDCPPRPSGKRRPAVASMVGSILGRDPMKFRRPSSTTVQVGSRKQRLWALIPPMDTASSTWQAT